MKQQHAVVIVGGGPTGLMLAGELKLANVDVAVVERRETQELAGTRAVSASLLTGCRRRQRQARREETS